MTEGPQFPPELVARLTETVRAIEAGEIETKSLTDMTDEEILIALLGPRE
jgi:hypothetical protein